MGPGLHIGAGAGDDVVVRASAGMAGNASGPSAIFDRPAQRVTSGREQQVLRQILLVAEVSLGVSLLACAGLLSRSFLHVLQATRASMLPRL